MALGQCDQRLKIVLVGDRALRVGGRAEIGDRGPRQQRLGERRIVGQVAGGGRRRDEHRLGGDGGGGHGIDLIEGVRNQDRRPLAAFALGAEGKGRVEQPLARAVQRRDPRRRQVDAIAALQPARDRRQQFRRALVRRIFRQFVHRTRDHLAYPVRESVARLADCQDLPRPVRGCHAVQQFPQARKRVFGQVREPLGNCHHCLARRSHVAPFAASLAKSAICVHRKAAVAGSSCDSHEPLVHS